MKAKVHVNRSFSARDASDIEQAALWAATALELLGKAALSKVSPLLVADPTDDGHSLLIAAGLKPDVGRFKSIQAKAVFSRCARAFKPFSEKEAVRIAAQRNEELHSALTPFTDQDEDEWWDRYWAQAVILVDAQDETLPGLVGPDREGSVEAHLARNSANTSRRVEAMIDRAAQRYALAVTSEDARREIYDLVERLKFGFDFTTEIACPACENPGALFGDDVIASEVEEDYEQGTAVELLQVSAEFFECEECGLRLDGPAYVAEAGLPESFDAERDYEPVYDDYGND
ncbi:MAG: hypothetical protein M3O70_28540 [Actinomycetota bacterium]|nr:hypothetical protein [Actinomycetota bacterium]